MKTKRPLFNLPGLLAGVLLACTLRLPAQSPPVITTQPAGQTNLVGTTANVIAAGWSGIGTGAAFMLCASVLLLSIPTHIARIFTPDPGVIAAGAAGEVEPDVEVSPE